jgi:hypothetical protein
MYFIDGINKKCIMLNNFDNSNYDIINYIIFNNPLIFIFIMIQLILFYLVRLMEVLKIIKIIVKNIIWQY